MNQADVMPEVMSGSALRLPGTWERPILAHRMTRGSSAHHLKRLAWALDERIAPFPSASDYWPPATTTNSNSITPG